MAGETVALARGAQRFGTKLSSRAVTAAVFNLTYGSTNNELNDVMQAGYLPAGVVAFQVNVIMSDMETSTTNVRHKVTIGSTDVASALALGGAGGSGVYAFTPVTTTAPTLVSVTTTTAAGTGAAGTATVIVLYYSA